MDCHLLQTPCDSLWFLSFTSHIMTFICLKPSLFLVIQCCYHSKPVYTWLYAHTHVCNYIWPESCTYYIQGTGFSNQNPWILESLTEEGRILCIQTVYTLPHTLRHVLIICNAQMLCKFYVHNCHIVLEVTRKSSVHVKYKVNFFKFIYDQFNVQMQRINSCTRMYLCMFLCKHVCIVLFCN